MRRTLFAGLILAAAMFVAAPSAMSQSTTEGRDPAAIADAVSKSLSRLDLDEATGMLRIYMGAAAAEKVRPLLEPFKNFGANQYTEKIYQRDFGKTTRDIIYKHNFDKAVVYSRYIFHLENNKWIVLHFAFKTENELPFPKDWQHIYP
jgi:hypothetical protein